MRHRLLIAAALAGLVALSLGIGAASLRDGDGGWVLAVSRFPRTAAALLAGAGLALAGVVVQQVVRNRLVEPSLTGTPEAAMLGLLAVTLISPDLSVAGKMLTATAAGLAGMAGFLALADRVPRLDPMLLPIVGLVYAGILGAAATYVAWSTDLMQFLGIWGWASSRASCRGATNGSGASRRWPGCSISSPTGSRYSALARRRPVRSGSTSDRRGRQGSSSCRC